MVPWGSREDVGEEVLGRLAFSVWTGTVVSDESTEGTHKGWKSRLTLERVTFDDRRID